jgi:hypothetical protein
MRRKGRIDIHPTIVVDRRGETRGIDSVGDSFVVAEDCLASIEGND